MPTFNEDEFRNSINSRKKPPVPKYSKEELEFLGRPEQQAKFKLQTVVMKHKESGHKIIVNANDDEKRLRLATLGYGSCDEPRTPANEKIEVKSDEKEDEKKLKFSESSIRQMNKKDLLQTAKQLGLKPEGDIEEFRESLIKKIKEEQSV